LWNRNREQYTRSQGRLYFCVTKLSTGEAYLTVWLDNDIFPRWSKIFDTIKAAKKGALRYERLFNCISGYVSSSVVLDKEEK